jgi:hypothetical protein
VLHSGALRDGSHGGGDVLASGGCGACGDGSLGGGDSGASRDGRAGRVCSSGAPCSCGAGEIQSEEAKCT